MYIGISGGSFAFAAEDPCLSNRIQKIDLPVFPDQKDSARFNFSYEYRKGAKGNLPLIIFIPGGPGLTSIGSESPVSKDFDVVLTDPRGSGCNTKEFPEGAYSTNFLASDILALINHIHPKTYVLYGASYGTLLATVIAHRAEGGEAQVPLAVVLEGVLGRAWAEKEDPKEDYIKQWKRVLSALAPKAKDRILTEGPLLGLPGSSWASFIEMMLNGGRLPGRKEMIVQLLDFLAPNSSDQDKFLQGFVKQTADSLTSAPPKSVVELYRQIACREIFPKISGMSLDFDFNLGELTPLEATFCGSLKLDRPYDSGSYSIQAPIYYFAGGYDPATPQWQAEYHFEHQKIGKKFLISVNEGGHTSLRDGLADCKDSLWLEKIASASDLEDRVFSSCELKTTLRRKN